MYHYEGQIAEYGTQEFENNKSIFSILDCDTYINEHGVSFPVEFYHRTEGYKLAGSCAIWTSEVWGYRIYDKYDNTYHGKYFYSEDDARFHWNRLISLNE